MPKGVKIQTPLTMSEGFTGEKTVSQDPWDELYLSMEKGEILQGKVKGVEKDALLVDIGPIRGVIPHDEIGEPLPKRLTAFVDAPVAFKIKRIDRANEKVYLSRKEALVEMSQYTIRELKRDCTKLLDIQGQIEAILPEDKGDEIPGEDRTKIRELADQARRVAPVRTGTVRTVVKEGAYMDIGGLPVFLPACEISWGRVEDARNELRPGESFDVKIIRVDFDSLWMRASLKALMPDPWENMAKRYVRNGIYAGEVKGNTKNGNLVIELEPGIVAICKRLPVNNPAVGTTVRVRVAVVEKDKRFIIGNIAGESRWAS